MVDHLAEQEQIECLKEWFKRYGRSILLLIMIVSLLVSLGYYWHKQKKRHLNQAIMLYTQLLSEQEQKNNAMVRQKTQLLLKNYADTPYGVMAALIEACDAIQQKNETLAKQRIEWVVAHSRDKAIRQIARLRLARILLAKQEATLALQVLSIVEDNEFKGLIAEIKGDAYFSLNHLALARKNYKEALSILPPYVNRMNPLLQMKYDNLA